MSLPVYPRLLRSGIIAATLALFVSLFATMPLLAEDVDADDEETQQEELSYRLVPGLTSSSGIDMRFLSASGHLIVWEDHRDGEPDVYLYDLSDGRESRVVNDGEIRRAPSVSGSAIVWIEGDEPAERVVRMLDLAEDAERQISGEPSRVDRPVISSDLVAWQERTDGRWLIRVADRSGNELATLGEELSNSGRPSVGEGRLVWQGYDGDSWNLYQYDAASDSVSQLTSENHDDQYPQVADDFVVFVRTSVDGGPPELVAIPHEEGEAQSLVTGHFIQRPSTHSSLVVWEDWRSGLPDIYAFDLRSSESFAIARSQEANAPAVSDSVVAWISGNDPSNQRIQTMEIEERLPTDPHEPPAVPSPDRLYIPETQQFVSGGFKSFWQANGGPQILGYPLTDEFTEIHSETGEEIVVQYFERVKLEFHPDASEDNRIQLALLGDEAAPDAETAPVEPFENSDVQTYFPETGHGISYGFKEFWEENGGLALFGFPITDEFTENGRTVQYFQRARFEHDPEAGTGDVSLGLLGREELQDRGWLPPPPLDTTQIFE